MDEGVDEGEEKRQYRCRPVAYDGEGFSGTLFARAGGPFDGTMGQVFGERRAARRILAVSLRSTGSARG